MGGYAQNQASMNVAPPKWPQRLLRLVIRDIYLEEIEGDMEEVFQEEVQKSSLRRARRRYAWGVILLLRPNLLKHWRFFYPYNCYDMLVNHLKIAWRKLLKNASFSMINIGGLALGMLVPMLIGLWIHQEFSYNQQYHNADRIAQVLQNQNLNGIIETWRGQAAQLEPALRSNYGNYFKNIAITNGTSEQLILVKDIKHFISGGYFSPDISEMLALDMLEGDRGALVDPSSILLSAKAAHILFNRTNPIGQTVTINQGNPLTVRGVYEDLPKNSSFGNLHFIAPWEDYRKGLPEWLGWGNSWFRVYVELAEDIDLERASELIRHVKKDNIEPAFAQRTQPELLLFPMRDWYLKGRFENGVNVGGRIYYIWLFGMIAVFVLLLACINFMNLNTARSTYSAKEVGIRKTLGTRRQQLIQQFFSESMLISSLAFIVAFIMLLLILPVFNSVMSKELSVLWLEPWWWIACLGFTFLTGLLAGSYPALYLSSFQPIKVLKGKEKVGWGATLPRQVLVVVQFTVSILYHYGDPLFLSPNPTW